MKLKDKNLSKKSKKSSISVLMYVFASIAALVGIAALANNIILFRTTVAQYVAQGYDTATVNKLLIPSQLLPGIFEPIAVYWGIAFVLLGAGILNEKISKCLGLLTKWEACNGSLEEDIYVQSSADKKDTEIMETAQDVETVNETEETQG
ncbi:MAG: hypothetical protein K0R54_1046 [Clostridiaceae bacterium]|jgi:hypothetical protein|nr:hypothetical protein [Clostridiaceae bacterium]